jgi:hypothetical protein
VYPYSLVGPGQLEWNRGVLGWDREGTNRVPWVLESRSGVADRLVGIATSPWSIVYSDEDRTVPVVGFTTSTVVWMLAGV